MNLTLQQQINDNPAACAAREIVKEIQGAGFEARFVGGGVRDLLMNRSPEDFDLATAATPEQLARLFPDALLVGAKFGVLLVKRNGYAIEVATFREEGEYHDRRRPDLVKFSDLRNDAIRRDFTANALYYNPISDTVTDIVGGVNDISNRILRTVGRPADRLKEDALRVMRGLRFAANLEYEIESQTWDAICECMPLLREISVERKRDELVKGLTGGHPARFLQLLDDSGFLAQYLPEIVALKGCEQPPEYHPEGDVFVHTLLMLQNLKPSPSVELALATLLHDIAKPPTQTFEDRIRFNGHDKLGAEMSEDICRRFRFSNQQIEAVSEMVLRHMQFINVPTMRKSTLQRFIASPLIEDELELHRVDCVASHGNLETYNFTLDKLKQFQSDEGASGHLPKPLITGEDLIQLGYTPGPAFGPILKQLFDAQLEGLFSDHESGRRFATEIAENIYSMTAKSDHKKV